eukprot:CAMPEP_0172556924 /NCGR_PEP_ID=MMETSP1067-20121228/70206_1 /TAXON_ID=265564 ORGANISM="Thalassiosira punctigera, Strain Tpunct2005C2" /NCGR_SAMPLE_ID=MMETSP1067 /ASSEMBLY_ACC=CAM_ASM_000444 /LENGTH=258 /DNA_ID=CAMNT_0013345861 /DNA_START=75 /DNA_END=851 /DNA_ORIENTATION=-
MDDLQRLLSCHLMAIPFENMDQHEHPAHEGTPLIPRRKKLPSLDVFQSLNKIVNRNRGGFCFELNFSFNWLLSSLGYNTRIALADVSCNQIVPAHVVILVEDLMDVPVLVDVGFGTPGVCNVPLPIQFNASKEDLHGDKFEFKRDDGTDRFDTALYRTRISMPDVEEPMYRFCVTDNMEMTAAEFRDGLDRVLTTSPTFNEKRLCVLSNSRGHTTLGRDYIKWVEKGSVIRQVELPHETAWRVALVDHFGIILTPDEA